MNKWRIYVAGIAMEVQGEGDYTTLKKSGLFTDIEQIDAFITLDRDNLWIYKVMLNGRPEIAVIKRTENEHSTSSVHEG
ncbi:hypothetical protein FMM75_02055 [Lachnospiraceae bacterium MD335]|mgnify:CR=1 FL=1|jgi:hypothetical protein|nr:hypothetical protein [Lachnospiraceae bacterium MD335]